MTIKPKLAHVVLQTNQLQAMRAFYLTLLEAEVVHENTMLCFITFDDEHHRVALFQPPIGELPERTPLTVGLAHVAYSYGSLGELMATYARLKHAGITPRAPVQHGVTTSLYYRDPDGNMVELQVDNFDSPAAATAYMQGEEYAADPVGPSFDPDRMAEACAKGVDAEELKSRRWALQSPQLNVLELLAT